jgi:cation transport protein ChaC
MAANASSRTKKVRSPPLLSDQALEGSLQAALANGPGQQDVHVFAYGSLLWNPESGFVDPTPARVYGYHRRFCLWSRINRGTPDRPGLVLALAHGGSCTGLVYRIPAAFAADTLRALWRREMLMGSYLPRWVRCSASDGRGKPITALTFVINRESAGYSGRLALVSQAQIIASGCGRYGHACDYLFNTQEALASLGLRDRQIDALVTLVRARLDVPRSAGG